MENNTVWTKNFKLITLSTIIFAIAGEAINLPLSLLVFDETKSTFLSAILIISGMLPDVIIPIFIAPFIDRYSKKKLVIYLFTLMTFTYLLFAFIIRRISFVYNAYLIFSLVVGTISVIFRLAYQAWYPDLIPIGFEHKGYAVASTIYPTVMIVMAPVATYLYEHLHISTIFFIVVALMILCIVSLIFIDNDTTEDTERKVSFDFNEYKSDIKAGFTYLKQKNGIRNIYTYMGITNGTGFGSQMMVQAYFQTAAFLSTTMLGFLRSAETIGRTIGGVVQYRITIPREKKYNITKFVYTVYNFMDMILLFMPYPLMLINRFCVGFLGISSATIRESSVNSYLPANMRAKVNAVFNVILSFAMIIMQIFSGLLGDKFSYRLVCVIMSLIGFLGIFIFIVLPSNENRKVYESTRAEA